MSRPHRKVRLCCLHLLSVVRDQKWHLFKNSSPKIWNVTYWCLIFVEQKQKVMKNTTAQIEISDMKTPETLKGKSTVLFIHEKPCECGVAGKESREQNTIYDAGVIYEF